MLSFPQNKFYGYENSAFQAVFVMRIIATKIRCYAAKKVFSLEYGVLSIEYRLRQKHIFGSQVSVDQEPGAGLQVRVRMRVLNLYQVLNT